MWFNCAALRGMGWLGRLEVIVVPLVWRIVDALFHVERHGTWTSILHGRCSTNMTSWPPDRFCVTHAIGQRSWTERSCEMLVIPQDHPTGSHWSEGSCTTPETFFGKILCRGFVPDMYCQRSGAWGSCDCGSSQNMGFVDFLSRAMHKGRNRGAQGEGFPNFIHICDILKL